jgi:hypothetical protein
MSREIVVLELKYASIFFLLKQELKNRNEHLIFFMDLFSEILKERAPEFNKKSDFSLPLSLFFSSSSLSFHS